MGVVIGVDGGNTKTDLVVATLEGEPTAYVRGAGSNSHGPGGAAGCVAVIAGLVEQAAFDGPAEHGAFFLCGADVPEDIEELRSVLETQSWVKDTIVDNDAFALLQLAGAADAAAVVCGGGINCVGRRFDGRTFRRPTLGWETGDWGGAEDVGRAALHEAARAEDGRGPETVLTEIVRTHFGLPSAHDVGEAVHYRTLPETRLGELAPLVVTAAADDAVAAAIVERLVTELVLLVRRAADELELGDANFDVVLGGGMFVQSSLRDGVAARLRAELPHARAEVPDVPAAAGAALAALAAAGAPTAAAERLRAAFAAGYSPHG